MRGATRQRGAAAVFVAISLVASVAALGMSLDLGRLYFMHRDLQLVADMAALDAARSAAGCLGQTEDPQGSAAGEAAASLQRNGASLAWLTAGSVEVGRQVTRGGVRSFVPDDSTRADSVKVTLRRPLPSRLVPVFSSGSGGVMATSAAASLRPIVSIDVGSGVVDVTPGAVPLIPPLLGFTVPPITLASQNGLFGVSVELGDLAVAANAGSVETFLDTETTAPGLLDAIASALDAGTDAATRTTLQALAAGADTSRPFVPREVLGVPAGRTADDALVNVGALVTSLAQAADSDNFIRIDLPVNLPPLLAGTVNLQLIELARPAIGPPVTDASGRPQTFANTAQALLQADVNLNLPGVGASIKMYVQLADASAGVTDLHCAQRGRPQPVVTVETQTSIGGIGIGEFTDITIRNAPQAPRAATITEVAGVKIMASAFAEFGADAQTILTFEGPFPAPAQTIGTDPGEALARVIGDMEDSLRVWPDPEQLRALDVVTQGIVQAAADALAPQLASALRTASTNVLAPLLDQLGVNFGSARVQVLSVVAQQPEIYAR